MKRRSRETCVRDTLARHPAVKHVRVEPGSDADALTAFVDLNSGIVASLVELTEFLAERLPVAARTTTIVDRKLEERSPAPSASFGRSAAFELAQRIWEPD